MPLADEDGLSAVGLPPLSQARIRQAVPHWSSGHRMWTASACPEHPPDGGGATTGLLADVAATGVGGGGGGGATVVVVVGGGGGAVVVVVGWVFMVSR
jgi:hypothetical protein